MSEAVRGDNVPRGDKVFQITFSRKDEGMKNAMHARAAVLGLPASAYVKMLIRADLQGSASKWYSDMAGALYDQIRLDEES